MKKSIVHSGILIVSAGSITGHWACTQKHQKVQPNIIYILADDLGYGDLSCYGQEKFSTPNIDKLASGGMLFTQHYSGSTVSAPSRSALMTGLHTGHTPIRGNKELPDEGQWPMPVSSITIPELLKQAGYTTGAFGKWGLGPVNSEGEPNNQGFDEYFGYNCQRLAHTYYPEHLWHNREKILIPENRGLGRGVYAPSLIQEKALEFIRKNKDNRFFMFYANTIPHAELAAPENYMAKFRSQFSPDISYKGTDTYPETKNGGYASQEECRAAFVAMITLLDDQVGEIVSELKRLGIADNTVIIFTSDNGPHLEGGADPDFFDSNGPLKGYKRDLYEGGIRVPMIVSWPAVIKKAKVSNHVSAFWDVLPTFAEMAGVKVSHYIDGISFLPALTGKKQAQHPYLYWEFHEWGGRKAIRMDNWKFVQYNVFDSTKTTTALYDLGTDVGEVYNVAETFPEVVKKMEDIMRSARFPSDVFKFGSEN